MAPRPTWKGHFKLSLVSCPVALYSAIDTSERLAFRQVNRRTGNRLRHQLVDTVTGDAVASFDKGRGFEVAQNQFVVVEDEELERARAQARQALDVVAPAEEPERSRRPDRPKENVQQQPEPTPLMAAPRPRIANPRSIDIEHFIPREQVDARYHLTPYYMAPRDVLGHEIFAVIRDAMAAKDVVGLARIVLSNRERPILIEPLGAGLRGMTLRYAHEIRSEAEVFGDIPEMILPAEMLEVAGQIVESKTRDFDAAWLEDRYRSAVVSLLQDKKAQLPPRTRHVPARNKVVNLMEILRRSLASARPVAAERKDTAARRAVAAAARPASTKRAKLRGPSRSG